MATNRSFMIGDWLVEPDLDRIKRGTEVRSLRPQVMELLVFLSDRPRQVVSNHELQKNLWGDRIVTDGSLYNCVSELRVVLSGEKDGAPAIETIPKKGYRLVSPVSPSKTAVGSRVARRRLPFIVTIAVALIVFATLSYQLRDRGEPVTAMRSLAVLPLDNHSPNPERDEYFTDGMTEALITRLGQIRGLKVISRTSAMRLKGSDMSIPEIARTLDVDGVIEGSVMTANREVRVTLQLIDGRTDAHLWARSYVRSIDDVFDLQEEIADTIAAELHIQLVDPNGATSFAASRAPPPTSSSQAYRAYLKGRYAFNQFGLKNFQSALRHYEDAVDLDPTFALAYASLAETCMQPAIIFSGLRELDDCKQDALRATALDNNLAEAYAALGFVRLIQWEWQQAESDFDRAIALDANSVMARQWHAELLRALYRFDESHAEIQRAEELDPLNLFVKTMVGWPLYDQHEYEQALAQWSDVVEMDPGFMLAHYNQGLAYIELRQPDEVFAAAKRVANLVGPNAIEARLLTASGHAISGEKEKSLLILASVERDAGMFVAAWIASIYLMLGDEDEALARLEKGLKDRSVDLLTISEPKFDAIRQHPRFRALSRKMGLPVRS